ncbi:MAG: glycerol-3-phosphate acyltransferase [SAR202 cluster bacterium]|jgi:glycerol-3-phosphate acyltransferase PlsY|nr:glycerol-3-phosphate acyltransferase [SAR202 cluster bacterium]
MIETVFALVVAFALGSMPTAIIIGRMFGRRDIREAGSGNAGALNAYRQMGKRAGLFVLLVDSGKGAVAVFIAQRLGAPALAVYGSAVLATLGHNFSPFLGFRGGKGAATVLGISALMLWQLTAITVVFGGALYVSTRHAVWSMTGVFVLLNGLTIGTFQPMGQILLCLLLSFVVAGTHFWRQYPQVALVARQRQWRKFKTIE